MVLLVQFLFMFYRLNLQDGLMEKITLPAGNYHGDLILRCCCLRLEEDGIHDNLRDYLQHKKEILENVQKKPYELLTW